ncbi:MAG TPA: hypothetical protein PKY82_00215 [Pyrinomonadaceae bacterium]|jgi:uncharacterized membrane protein|nr:hypothetical protein [Pyrinomonadaceae bacterium]
MNGKTALGLDTNIGSLLCYLPICLISLVYSIIVIVSDKDNKAVRFHAFQSLLLTGLYIVLLIGVLAIGGILAGVTGSSAIAALVSLLYFAVIIGFLILMIVGCIKGFTGGSYKLPIIGGLAEKWS